MYRSFSWNCDCGRKLTAKVRQGKNTASRTCAKCRRVWRLDVAAGTVRCNSFKRQEWEGTSSTGTQSYAGTSEDLALCTDAGKYHAVCHDHGQTVATDSWSMAKHCAQHTDEFCSVCCGDLGEGVRGDLGEMDERWAVEDSEFFKRRGWS